MTRFLLPVLMLSLMVVGGQSAHAGGGNVFVVNAASNIGDNNIADEVCDVDPGPDVACTFRAALQEANDEPGMDGIQFADGSTQALVSTGALPDITDPVAIDGGTANCGVPACISISGDVQVAPNGLTVHTGGSGSSIRGLILKDWTNAGIIIGEDTTGVTIAGNYIGTDSTGLVAEPNLNGIVVTGSGNTIGGVATSDRNVISGNSNYGVQLWGENVTSNIVQNNYIGVGSDGATALGNSEGVHFTTTSSGRVAGSGGGGGGNTIGPDNVIGNNQNEGICLCDADGNTVSGNYIGVDATGNNAAPNDVGIFTFGSNNFIGGTSSSERNIISGNDEYGIDVSGSTGGGVDNTIIGNYIGTNASGVADLGNGKSGVFLGSATGTQVGSESAGQRNVISGNAEDGVVVYDSMGTSIIGNYMGTRASGEQGLGNGQHGISVVQGSANGNIEANVIAANGNIGLMLDQGATGFLIERNRIGVSPSDDPIGNVNHGILVRDSGPNMIGSPGFANTIAFNGGDGVRVSTDAGSATGNTISGNSIYSNALKGIENINGGNNELPPPVISGGLRAGVAIAGTSCTGCSIEIFSDSEDEGRIYEGSTFADDGTWSFNEPVSGPFITATATDSQDGSTSEFSLPVTAPVEETPTPEPTEEPTPEPTETPVPTGTPAPTPTPGPSVTPGPSETPVPGARQGDTDCDRDADSVDALFVLREVAGFAPSKCIENGDVDCDEDRDSVDALGILRHVAALPPLVQQEPCADIGTPI